MIHARPSVFVRKLEERYCQIVKNLAVYYYERTKCREEGEDRAKAYDQGIRDLMARKDELETILHLYEYTPDECRDLKRYASRLAGFAVQDRKEKEK